MLYLHFFSVYKFLFFFQRKSIILKNQPDFLRREIEKKRKDKKNEKLNIL